MDDMFFIAWKIVEWSVEGLLYICFPYLMGQAVAETWRPAWQIIVYSFLLALGYHFIRCALFNGEWLSILQYMLNSLVILVISALAYRLTQARKMVTQYPWLYERSGLLGWKEKSAA